ncbi:MAG: hypothetical protein H6779_00990 [Candidatus Nomurabacteria bacterium]|nr:hypothetical protein [Candidatus Nomurabacteria bacterium]USN88006.1 MAG: hypothetical protein H6779_00990 [Candidatus Nomurabacteria bacterium]
MQQRPVTSDLFRFFTLRTPQLLDPARRDSGFIYISSELSAKSLIIKDLSDDLPTAREELQSAAKKFKSIKTYREVRELAPGLYDFSHWLSKRRASITLADVEKKLAGLNGLSAKNARVVWDNLFYQLIVRDSPVTRQACSRLLVADNFLYHFKETDFKDLAVELIETPRTPKSPSKEKRVELYLRRLANAKVVIPKAFSTERQTDSSTSAGSGFGKGGILDRFGRSQKMARGKSRLNTYKTLKNDVSLVSSKVDEDATIAAVGSEIVSKKISLSTTAKDFFDRSNTKKKTVTALESDLNSSIRRTRSELHSVARDTGALRYDGNADIKPFTSYLTISEADDLGSDVFLTLNTNTVGAKPTSVSYSLKKGNTKVASGKEVEIVENDDSLLNLKLFPGKDIDTSTDDNFGFTGKFIFDDGSEMELEIPNIIPELPSIGVGKGTKETEETEETEEGSTELYGVNRLGIGIFRKVEQEVCCYVPGEVSRIENIMAREYKERHTRTLSSTETTTEESTESEVENQTDTSSTVRNELQSEIAKVLEKGTDLGAGASAGVSGEYMGVTVSAEGNFDYASANSASTSDTDAKTYAEEVVNNALERIVQKTSYKRTVKMLEEYEENNRHGYDNREGDEHVTGVYRWIDIVYVNRLINYGKRLMVEFLIPEPAKFYKFALEQQALEASGVTEEEIASITPPPTLADLGIKGPSDIEGYDEPNYEELAAEYGITISAPETETSSTSKTYNASNLDKGDEFTGGGQVALPAGYQCTSANVSVSFRYDSKKNVGTNWRITVGSEVWTKDVKGSGNDDRHKDYSFTLNMDEPIGDLVEVAISGHRTLSYSLNVTLNCEIDPDEYAAWQSDAYDSLLDAYEEALREYESDVAEQEAALSSSEEEVAGAIPSSSYRSIEQREIKRVAIEMLTSPFGITQGQDFYQDSMYCNVPQVNQSSSWEEYSSHVKFFEQAFDWSIMSYLFYPYYWAGKCDWANLVNTLNESDETFEAFLQSGMARVVVPVRIGFESAIDYYLETGDIWNGGDLVIETDDDLYLSIEEELAEVEGFVEEEWQTRVPTSLTIIQGNSVYLDDEGLPCCGKYEGDTQLLGSSSVLGGSSSDETDEDADTDVDTDTDTDENP